jgi:ATP-dependent Lhr-like helicase
VRAFGLEKATDVQNVSIPSVLKGDECLIIAETGSGKTESVMVPLLHLVREKAPVSCLYVTPLRALNRDIFMRMEKACQELNLRIETRHGDTSQRVRHEQLLDPPHILVTTPETFQALLVAPKFKEHLKNVRFVVIDEIHELMDNKRGPQLASGVARLRRVADFRLYGLSATVSEPGKVAKYFWPGKVNVIQSRQEKAKEVAVEVPRATREDLSAAKKSGIPVRTVAKLRRINEISSQKGTLIFTNTRSTAEVLTSRLLKLIDVNIHHGSLSKEHRESVERKFKEGIVNRVISTSSLQLGIDVGHVDQVVQYGSPRRVDAFTQRVGRSGHFIHRLSKGTIICDGPEAPESAVIARKTLDCELEPIEVVERPLDVIAHQLVGLALELGEVGVLQAFTFLRGVWPFRELTPDKFKDVLGLMEQLGYVRIRGDTYHRRGRAWRYYYRNITTIPDERSYRLIDSSTRKSVATLDADFVEELKTGEQFVVAGTSWSVVNREGNRVYAARTGNTDAVATWSGELIPVDFSVAREIPEAINNPEKYPYSERARKVVLKLGKYGEGVRVEHHKDLTLVITWAGNKVNNTLAHVLGSFYTAQFGQNVGLRSDEFGIIVKGLPRDATPVEEVLRSIDRKRIRRDLRVTAGHSHRFRKAFIHVAKRFGVIERGRFEGISPKRFVQLWEGSVVDEEAFSEYVFKKMDVDQAGDFLDSLEEIGIEQAKLSGIGRYMVEKFYPDVFEASRPKKQILRALKVRLMGTSLPLGCLYCKTFLGRFRVDSAPEACPECGSKFLGVVRDRSLLRKRPRDLSVEQKRELESARLSGNLFLSYGRRALVVQAGRGVGPRTAARILRKSQKEAETLDRVYEAEKTYARTKAFWD